MTCGLIFHNKKIDLVRGYKLRGEVSWLLKPTLINGNKFIANYNDLSKRIKGTLYKMV